MSGQIETAVNETTGKVVVTLRSVQGGYATIELTRDETVVFVNGLNKAVALLDQEGTDT